LAGQFITFCRNVCTVNEQKVEILFRCSIENFQPKPLRNSEQSLLLRWHSMNFSRERQPNNEPKAEDKYKR
jgi:hypothetical protein